MHRPEETLDVEQESQDNSRSRLPGQNLKATENKNQSKGTVSQYLGCRHHEPLQLGRLHIGIQVCLVDGIKSFQVHPFPGQALGYPHTGNTLLQIVINRRNRLAHLDEGTAGEPLPDDHYYG